MTPKRKAIKRAMAKPHTPKPKVRPYWWFQGDSVDDLTARLNASPGARLEVRIDAKQHMTLTVVPPVGVVVTLAGEPINKSFICPPICP